MIYDNVGGIRDPLKQDLALAFCRKKDKGISILNETHINHNQIHHIRKNWFGPIFFAPGDSHTKRLLLLLHLGLEGITEAHTDSKGRFMYFKVTPSNDRFVCVNAPSRHSTREQLTRGRFFEGLQSYMENKNEGNEKKTILGDFNCTMDKMDRYGWNKAQRLDGCCSINALPKLIVDNALEDLWRRENPGSPEFTSYDRSFGKAPG